MAGALNIGVMVFSVIAGAVAVVIGHREVQKLRKETGDRSAVTSVLSGEFFSKHDKPRRAA
jgi:hypothetical protein